MRKLYYQDPHIDRLQALKAIGYPQVLEHVKTQQPIDLEKIKQTTRNLAKKLAACTSLLIILI